MVRVLIQKRLVAVTIITVAAVACGTASAPTPNIGATVEAVVEQRIPDQELVATSPALALSSSGAESLLRGFLISCIERSEELRSGANADWWKQFAMGEVGPQWSARFLRFERSFERWVVNGAGLERDDDDKLVPVQGTWQVTAGRVGATPLDFPAMTTSQECEK